eukprot:GDKJ01016178.1.p1 GENE.GDKJ01016178.1~~GDKJ01016178.1.p1  ORF type:complete len:782 (+),score=139.78 GDKJ01016178.1:55-2400(+)
MIPAKLIPEGHYTERIYGMINAREYDEAIKVLKPVAQSNSRAALSLLAYCHYHLGAYEDAVGCYEQLNNIYPSVDLYKFYLGQCHYKAGNTDDALRVLNSLDYQSPRVHEQEGETMSIAQRALLLQAQIKYENDCLDEARLLLEDCDNDNADVKLLLGGIEWKEKKIAEARKYFLEAKNALGDIPPVKYNLALCHYSENDYAEAFKIVGELVDNAVRTYPNIGIGAANHNLTMRNRRRTRAGRSNSDVIQDYAEDDVVSTDEEDDLEGSDSQKEDMEDDQHVNILKGAAQEAAFIETCLVEALNLRATVEYCAGLPAGVSGGSSASVAAQEAYEALNDVPPRPEEEVDYITLHNLALFEADSKPQESFRKLAHLVDNRRAPATTLKNLLILFCRAGLFNRAADLQADLSDPRLLDLSANDFDLIDSLTISSQSPEQGATKFENLVNQYTENSHRLSNQIQESTTLGKNEETRELIPKLEDTIGKQLLPAVIGLAKVFWDAEQYENVERMLWKSRDLCSDDLTWRLSLAHSYFMQNKYADAADLYETVVRVAKDRSRDSTSEFSADALLDLQAVVLANLCVSYVMTSRNIEAENLMKEVESAEMRRRENFPGRPSFHFCIINLVIGTLYCVKDQYGFGVGRVVSSLEPIKNRLGIDTWFYAKRCLLSLADQIARQSLVCEDFEGTINSVLDFLEKVDRNGRHILASNAGMPAHITQAVNNYHNTRGGHFHQRPVLDGIENMDKKVKKKLQKMLTPQIPLQYSISYEARLLKALFLKLSAPDM